MSSHHNHSDYDWNSGECELPAHIRERLLWNQLVPAPSAWDRFVDLMMTIAIFAIFLSPIWIQFIGD